MSPPDVASTARDVGPTAAPFRRARPGWGLRLGLLGVATLAVEAAGDDVDGAADGTCSALGPSGCKVGPASAPIWPYKNGDLNRSGLSPYAAPFDLSEPTWIFEEPDDQQKSPLGDGVFHSGPIVDEHFNVYFTSTNGRMYSLTKSGVIRWMAQLSGRNPGNPALLNGVLYTGSDDGLAHAVESQYGSIIWSVRIGMACPDDTYGAVAVNGTVLLPAVPHDWQASAHHAEKRPTSGGDEVVALNPHDGSVRWRYNHAKLHGAASFNVLPAVVGDSVIFDDMSGGVYRLALEDGRELWHTPGFQGTWSTGAALVGPNNRVYSARNRRTAFGSNGKDGVVRAHDFETGAVVWEYDFPVSMNVGLAVGPVVRSEGRPVVIAAAGDNNQIMPSIFSRWPTFQSLGIADQIVKGWHCLGFLHKLLYYYDKMTAPADRMFSQVAALDAQTGALVWKLDLTYADSALPNLAFRPASYSCAPDLFGNPSIGADGTVYISWSGGRAMALRDANGDGRIDTADPAEYSSYPHGFGSNGNPAIGPGFLVAPSCNHMIAWIS